MAIEIQKQRIPIGPVVPAPGISPRTNTKTLVFKNALANNPDKWIVALNGFHLEFSNGDDLQVLKQEVNVQQVSLHPGSNKKLDVEVAFLLADDEGQAAFEGWADVNVLAEV